MVSIRQLPREFVRLMRRLDSRRRERRRFRQLFPPRMMNEVVRANRRSLKSINEWISDADYEGSIFQYGLPKDVRHLIDLEQGEAPTYADAILALSHRLRTQVNYLEIGVSVGKTFWQVLNGVKNSKVTGFDIEDVNPSLARMLGETTSASKWQSPPESMRKVDAVDLVFERTAAGNSVRYLAADVFDAAAWDRLDGEKFNLIFSDAFHSPDALLHEFRMIRDKNLLDHNEFILVWDDLHGHMLDAFHEICRSIRGEMAGSCGPEFILPLNGWLGKHEVQHPVGFLLKLDCLNR
jgi:hypothetical protein